jgi:hypothetical protein
VIATTDLGPIERTAAIRGRDGGYSERFQGHSVWLYGDSILAWEGEDGTAWRNNTASWTLDMDASDGLSGFEQDEDGLGAPREVLPRTADEAAFNDAHAGDDCAEEPCGARYAVWPMDMVVDEARDRALLFYTEISGEPGDGNFYGVGIGLAEWTVLEDGPTRPVVDPQAEHPTLLFEEEVGSMGDAAVVSDGMLYAFGCDHPDEAFKHCRLGRVALEEAFERDAWRFLTADGAWSADFDDASLLFDGNNQMSVHYNAHLDRWVAIYAGLLSNEVRMRTAPALEGPWSRDVTLFETEPQAEPDDYLYCVLGHPEFQREDGRFEYVSYFRTTGDWQDEIRLVEVELDVP